MGERGGPEGSTWGWRAGAGEETGEDRHEKDVVLVKEGLGYQERTISSIQVVQSARGQHQVTNCNSWVLNK